MVLLSRRRGGEERDRQLWSKSSEQVGGAEAWQRWAPALVLQPYHLDTYTESYAAHSPLRYQRPEAAPGGGGESYQHNYVVKVGSRHITSTVYLATAVGTVYLYTQYWSSYLRLSDNQLKKLEAAKAA